MSYPPPPTTPNPGFPGNQPMPQSNKKAMWSMILGIISIVCCGILAGIPALILGNQAKAEIAASHGGQTGEGQAKAGVILGWISIALTIVGILFYVLAAIASN